MSRFKRKTIEPIVSKKKFAKPWLDPNYDVLAKNNIRKAQPTDEEMFPLTCETARLMRKLFGTRTWMKNFIDFNGRDKPYRKGMVTDGRG